MTSKILSFHALLELFSDILIDRVDRLQRIAVRVRCSLPILVDFLNLAILDTSLPDPEILDGSVAPVINNDACLRRHVAIVID